MISHTELLNQLWNQYVAITPSAKTIHALFEAEGEQIENDHIAIRTYDDPRVGIEVLEIPFLKAGYQRSGEYVFEAKKLFARHYQHTTDATAPKVFISELKLSLCSSYIQETVAQLLNSCPSELWSDESLLLKGRVWGTPSWDVYERLREESEYAAWMYVYGFCANHFTVNVNALKAFESLEAVNDFLESKGFALNASGGKIKGTPAQLLEQSSTLADMRPIAFAEGTHEIPSCYYEFARRYPTATGELYSGFIAASADKIFESTDKKLRM